MGDSHEGEEDSRWLHALSLRLRRTARRIAYGLPIAWPRGRRTSQQPDYTPGPLAAFSRYNRAYFQRWVLIGVLIGIGAGVSMVIFFSAIDFCTHLLLGLIAGSTPPAPVGEGISKLTPVARPWLIPVATTLGGLLTGLIVYKLAPETERGGTDQSIQAFHERNGRMRERVPLVKLAASALTIGSGGSAGREGAAAQIVAGIGSWIGELLHLDDHDRRIAIVAGIGSGIGTIFRAPFAGALFAAEVLYKRDFEADALFPTFIASVVGYAIYGSVEGWTPVFGLHTNFVFHDPRSLAGFLILGICAGFLGFVFHWAMARGRLLFDSIRVAKIVKPALGGLIVGVIGIFLPQALGMGYGYVQFGVDNNFQAIGGLTLGILVFTKIATTALTLGSGGSGGDVAPAMVVGGFLGGALWALLDTVAPGMVAGIQPGAFVIVGMASFFGGISNTPLAMILMVAEMTGQLSLIVPAMLATMIAYLITGDTSIYDEQIPTRLDSPAHKNDYALPLLQSLTVRDAMISGIAGALATAGPDTPLDDLSRLIRERRVASIPIIDRGRLVGVVTAVDLARVAPQEAEVSRARQVMTRAVVRAVPEESLYRAWLRMSRRGLRQLAVVDPSEPTRLLGIVTADSIAQLLRPRRAGAAAPATPQPAIPHPEPLEPALIHAGTESDETDDTDDTGLPTADEDEDAVARVVAATITAPASKQQQPVSVKAKLTGTLEPGASGTRPVRAPTMSDPLTQARVADAMLKTPRLVRETDPVQTARRLLEVRGNALMVADGEGRLVGIVTRSDLANRGNVEQNRALTIRDVMVRNLVTARPDESLRIAVHRMSALGLRQLPVVEGNLPAPPVGLLRRSDILAAYERMQAG